MTPTPHTTPVGGCTGDKAMDGKTQDKLAEAIAEVRRVVATDGTPWTHSDLPPSVPAAIYYAVATGQLVPATTAPAPEAASDAAREEPVAARFGFDGDGWLYLDSGSGSDWKKRAAAYDDCEWLAAMEARHD